MLPKSSLLFLSTFFVNYYVAGAQQAILEQATPGLTFQLRHLHALLPDNSQSLFAHVDSLYSLADPDQILQTNTLLVHKPQFLDIHTLNVGHWDLRPVLAPNISDRATLLEL